jgi:hypothetical protein
MAATREGHAQVIKIPEDRPQCSEKRDAEDHVPSIERYRVAIHGERLFPDTYTHVMSHATTFQPITVGNCNTGAGARTETDARASGHLAADEVMCRARVEQRDVLRASDLYVDLKGG